MILSRSNAYPRDNFIISFLRAIGFFLFYYAVRTVVFNAAAIFFVIKHKNEADAMNAYYENANMLSFVCGIIIIASIIALFSRRNESVRDLTYIGKPSVSVVIIAFFTGLSLNFTTNFVMSFLPQRLLESYNDSASTAQQGSLAWYILAAVVMAPVLEELIFRAMMVSRLSTSVGNIGALVISAVIFGVVHGHVVWSSYALLLGILLGFAFVRTRSLIVSVAMHMGFNLVSLLSYIDVESMSSLGTFIYGAVFTAISIASIPVSTLLVTLFVMKTKDTADKKPIGLGKIHTEGDL